MLIEIDKLKRQPRHLDVDEQATNFDALRDLVVDRTVIFNEPIKGKLRIARSAEVVEVTGHLVTSVTCPCSRCLTPVTNPLEVPVTLCYVSDDADKTVALAEDVELQSEELGLIPFSSSEIDLKPELAQEIVMALPQQPLCEVGCQGLCPVCGNNLNLKSCHCEPPIFHAGLAALRNIKINQ